MTEKFQKTCPYCCAPHTVTPPPPICVPDPGLDLVGPGPMQLEWLMFAFGFFCGVVVGALMAWSMSQ